MVEDQEIAVDYDFSVVITTRNRPALFKRALASVLDQKNVTFQVVVINDGSLEEHRAAYKAIIEEAPTSVSFITLDHSLQGHGAYHALNQGILAAQAEYLAFLDDDDHWTDPDYLSTSLAALTEEVKQTQQQPDMLCALQVAVDHQGEETAELLWHGLNRDRFIKNPAQHSGFYYGRPEECVDKGIFCHANTLILRRQFILDIGAFDEDLRYEGDREIYLRAIDQGARVLINDRIVSKHYIPDPGKAETVTTQQSKLIKLQYQFRLYTNLHMNARTPLIRELARIGQGDVARHLSLFLKEQGKMKVAAHYARIALMVRFSLKWMIYTVYMTGVGLFASNK
ncbi:glycosyltransferase [Temperatibacter marinus]|uniref:Glycosyltransferase n=1 Tax=Temperatibacter marinus TaxID=1456591 RepID=A0AA52H9Y5_9PROT|nr:glycosyltransferase [Temperatibacter marinus]WND03037.1 glycosyltransferase [Temperatibacter marinus]